MSPRAVRANLAASMGAFKFACPVCGQHITAESGNAGAHIECPTCFKKLLVPQSPSAEAPKGLRAAVWVPGVIIILGILMWVFQK